MNYLIKKLLAPRYEYLTLDQNLIILEASLGAQRFAEYPEALKLGDDVRSCFPELIGIEETLIDILEGRQTNFELKGVDRSIALSSPLYLDLYVSECSNQEASQKGLLVLVEDATERMILQQTLAQRANEAGLLVSSLTASKNYKITWVYSGSCNKVCMDEKLLLKILLSKSL